MRKYGIYNWTSKIIAFISYVRRWTGLRIFYDQSKVVNLIVMAIFSLMVIESGKQILGPVHP